MHHLPSIPSILLHIFNTRKLNSVICNHIPVISLPLFALFCDFTVTLLFVSSAALNKCHYICDHTGREERWTRRRFLLSSQEWQASMMRWPQDTHLELTYPGCTPVVWRRPQRHLCISLELWLQKPSNMCRTCWWTWNWCYSRDEKLSTYNLCSIFLAPCYSLVPVAPVAITEGDAHCLSVPKYTVILYAYSLDLYSL